LGVAVLIWTDMSALALLDVIGAYAVVLGLLAIVGAFAIGGKRLLDNSAQKLFPSRSRSLPRSCCSPGVRRGRHSASPPTACRSATNLLRRRTK
jgi:hypothetical protein